MILEPEGEHSFRLTSPPDETSPRTPVQVTFHSPNGHARKDVKLLVGDLDLTTLAHRVEFCADAHDITRLVIHLHGMPFDFVAPMAVDVVVKASPGSIVTCETLGDGLVRVRCVRERKERADVG